MIEPLKGYFTKGWAGIKLGAFEATKYPDMIEVAPSVIN